MPGYGQRFVDKVKRKFVCPLCQLPMRDPVQITTCGHRYCDTCLQEYLSEGIFKCPEDELPLDYAKIYPDPETEADIISSMVRCVHYKDGCKWVDKLQNLQSHLDICRYDALQCPNHCGAMLSRMCVDDHLEFTCPKRKVKCEFCGMQFMGEVMEVHEGSCQSEMMWCENKCGAHLQRRYLSNHMRNECHKRTLPCQYCHKEFVFETLQNHYHHCLRFPVTCPNRCDPMRIPREEVEAHLRDHCPSACVPCTFKQLGCDHLGPRFNLERHLDDCSSNHLSLMCQLATSQQKQIEALTQQLQTLTRITEGILVWKITDFSTKLANAKSRKMVEMESQPFYSSRYGYRLGASLFPNGNGPGEGTFMSLYIKLLPGEYDNILEWPMRLPISFTLLDQCTDPEKREPIKESFIPNPSWKHFRRPSKDCQSAGFGYPKFVSHETLRKGTYIRDNTVFIQIKVDTSSYILP